ncbi:flavoprotein-like protein [Achaetomium macrosporum]|uniref:Flavoprotein-like protein n=1 Tax=Achaetomium macrosporum TaxID=79813 RepID=A0AAN7C041_9PEZI|nr:flavoprotein-like protein [Achaetomium macrosporum]
MSLIKTFKVGIITGSQRVVRAGPQIAAWVLHTIQTHQDSLSSSTSPLITFDTIDIATLNLPLLTEPGIPSQIPSPSDYAHAHTREWAARIAGLDAFVFVSPQYNWGIPAGLKNALDYLYHEWAGKPAAIVTYGGHGGDKCAAQLRTVLGGGLRMRVVEPVVCLAFPSREVLLRAAKGEDLGLWVEGKKGGESACDDDDDDDDEGGMWADRKGEIVQSWEALVEMLDTRG